MEFQKEVNLNMPKPLPEQWNGDQVCQKCGNKLGWNNGTSTCGHVRHMPSWGQLVNEVLADLAKYEPGETLSAGLINGAKGLVQNVIMEQWARKAYNDKR